MAHMSPQLDVHALKAKCTQEQADTKDYRWSPDRDFLELLMMMIMFCAYQLRAMDWGPCAGDRKAYGRNMIRIDLSGTFYSYSFP